MKNIHLIYFSPSLSTRKIIRKIGKEMGTKIKEHDVTMGFPDTLNIESHDLVIFGIPVYAGRVPQLAVDAFEKIKGDKTPAVLVLSLIHIFTFPSYLITPSFSSLDFNPAPILNTFTPCLLSTSNGYTADDEIGIKLFP